MPSLVIELAVPAGAGGAAAGALRVTDACADFAVLAVLVAVTVKAPAVAPALNRPEVEIVPPVADQVTAVFDAPVTVAENCCALPVWTFAEVGLTVTETAAVSGGVLGIDAGPAEPVQPATAKTLANKQTSSTAPKRSDRSCRTRLLVIPKQGCV